jgi:hypothetical protein
MYNKTIKLMTINKPRFEPKLTAEQLKLQNEQKDIAESKKRLTEQSARGLSKTLTKKQKLDEGGKFESGVEIPKK